MDTESGPMADRLETWAQEFTKSSKRSKEDIG